MLRPFALSVALSLLVVAPQEDPKPFVTVFKVAPILCLTWIVLRKEIMRRETVLLLLALVFSMIGDFYLLWPKKHFLEGVMAFWVAQAIYIVSFGFKRVSWKSGLAAYGFNLLCLVVALNFIPSPPEKMAVTFYSFTLITVVWRALDRHLLNKEISWHRRVSGVVGTMVFCASDLCIALLQEGKMLPHTPTQIIILSTYYIAQALIVLGLCEGFWKL